jgi:hypothetical protein
VVLTLPNKSPKNLIFQWIAGFRSTNESQRITLKTMFPNPIFTPFVPKLFPKWNYPGMMALLTYKPTITHFDGRTSSFCSSLNAAPGFYYLFSEDDHERLL